MAWCPVCKNEYREGITHCKDCDADLVDELPEETFEQFEADLEAKIDKMNLSEEELEQIERDLEGMDEEEVLHELRTAKSTLYESKKDKYENFLFSGYSFIVFGFVGSALLLLNVAGIVDWFNPFSLGILFVMCIIFIAIGAHSIMTANKIKETLSDEEDEQKAMETWVSETFTDDYFKAINDDPTADDAYFSYHEQMLKDMRDAFEHADINLVDKLVSEKLDLYLEDK